MKKFLLLLVMCLGLMLPVQADNIMPSSVDFNNIRTLGLYQIPKDITIYEKPDETSGVINNIKWSAVDIYPAGVKFSDLFVVFIPSKELGYAAVTDETDGWIEIIYNNRTGETGWIKKDDPYKFLTWLNFYNTYGRKYGLYILKGAPDEVKNIRSGNDEMSQLLSEINMPTKIKLNAIRGNWALISVLDFDREPKTGYIRWRGDDGIRYLFPDIK